MANSVGLLGAAWGLLTGLSIGFIALLALRARQRADAVSALASSVPSTQRQDIRLATFESRELDVDHELSEALALLQDVEQRHQVEVQVAVQPKLTVWADPVALRQTLVGIISQAMERAIGSAVLISAGWHGGRVQMTVVDDGPPGDPAALAGRLREVQQCAALQGGTLEIECRSQRGNRVVVRMPGPALTEALAIDEEASDGLGAREAPWTGVLGTS